MRKIKDVLRLRFQMNLGQDQIARSCSISQATVHRYLERADSAGLTWPLPEDHDDRRLNELRFPTRPDYPPSVPRPGLDFAEVHRQLQANRFVTLQLLREEYREKQSGAYSYSRFCELYQRGGQSRDEDDRSSRCPRPGRYRAPYVAGGSGLTRERRRGNEPGQSRLPEGAPSEDPGKLARS